VGKNLTLQDLSMKLVDHSIGYQLVRLDRSDSGATCLGPKNW